jgi:ribosomal protein L25 (general stress protein Ctc)
MWRCHLIINIEVDENKLRSILRDYLQEQLGELKIDDKDIKIEVKSKQNYRSEWESAAFRAQLHKVIA